MEPMTLLALTSLAGAGIQAYGQYRTNSANAAYQQEANRLSIDLANTAHQREVADLRAAGLNPILSAGGSGAQTPALGAVQASNPYDGLANSASSVGRELARYSNDMFAGQVAGMKLDNESASSALEVQREQDQLDAFLIRQKREAIEKYLSPVKSHTNDYGHTYVSPDYDLEEKRKREVYKWLADGYVSDIKLRGNANWRSNLSSFVPFVNSAASVGSQFIPRTTRRFYR